MPKHDTPLHDAHPTPTGGHARRDFLTRAILAAAAAAIPSVAAAQDARIVSDAAVLNFLLQLEYVASALYRNAALRFTDRDFVAMPAGARQTLLDFSAQEDQHVAILQSLVTKLGVTPLQDCGDRFSRFTNLQQFLDVGLAVENAIVSGYLGVLPLLRLPQLQSAISSISSVESRHAAFVAVLDGQPPAPAAADTPKSRQEITALLSPYIRSCIA